MVPSSYSYYIFNSWSINFTHLLHTNFKTETINVYTIKCYVTMTFNIYILASRYRSVKSVLFSKKVFYITIFIDRKPNKYVKRGQNCLTSSKLFFCSTSVLLPIPFKIPNTPVLICPIPVQKLVYHQSPSSNTDEISSEPLWNYIEANQKVR